MKCARFLLAVLLAAACGGDDDGSTGAAGSSSSGGGESSTAATLTSTTLATTESSGGVVDGSSSDDGSSSGSSGSSSGGGVCEDEVPAIVTDIDETLTTSDAEFFMQIMDPTYDPMERAGGADLINGYRDLGYRILYLTARGENVDIADTDETAQEITVRWLMEHGYPLDPETTTVVLAPMLLVGDAAQMYKADELMELQAMGWRFDYAYGNATTDIGAYEDAGIDKAATFIIGDHAGEEGTVAIEGEDWIAHTAEQLPMVPAVCEAA
jgi:hypothetical protein